MKDGWCTFSETLNSNHTRTVAFFSMMRGKRNGLYTECLELIHDHIFSELETAMIGVAEALMAFVEKCKCFSAAISSYTNTDLDCLAASSEWLAMQKMADLERRCAEYMIGVFPPAYDIEEPGSWPTLNASEIEHFRQRLAGHRMYEFSCKCPYRV